MKKGVLISPRSTCCRRWWASAWTTAIVELDNLELPILDGSAQPFVEMIQQSGLRRQRRRRKYLRVLHPIETL